MKTWLLLIFGIISVALSVYFLVHSLHLYKKGKRAERILSSIQVFTIGIFLALVALFIPVYYAHEDFGDSYILFRPLLISVHNALRNFLLDGEFKFIVDALQDENIYLRIFFSLHAAVLYVIAPLLTFSNVLSLFKNIRSEFSYKINNKKKHYIMSELNVKSIALARSICREQKDAVIVFTDVFEQDNEEHYELVTQALDLNAICMKKDITCLDILSKKGDVEIFLIGNDESENVSQAAKIVDQLNKRDTKHNVKVFVFSSKPGAARIVDSISYDQLLKHACDNDFGEHTFKFRRINEIRQLIWNTVPKMKLFELADRHNKTLSVMVAGFGNYGTEFFKMLVWYCQFEGYRLEINIFDKQKNAHEKEERLKSTLERSFPELLRKNQSALEGEPNYDIRIFSDVDVMSSELDQLITYCGQDPERAAVAQRLQATNLAFVALGDDDTNIDVSIHLRSLFDRVNGINAKKTITWDEEPVAIYSVVFDDQKCRIMNDGTAIDRDARFLVNHKNVPYHIHMIGSMSSQFDYHNIFDAELEKGAYIHHTGWVDIEKRIHDEWLKAQNFDDIDVHTWYFSEAATREAVISARQSYERYEYYRLSSMAKELYQREVRNNQTLLAATTCLTGGDKQTCECENCVRRKRSEHMRWCAYTMTLGYSYSKGKRADRALLHDNLCPWGELSKLDRLKD